MSGSGQASYSQSNDERALMTSSEERSLIAELLDAEQARLLVEIQHTDHRAYRGELRRRLETIERMKSRWPLG